MPYNPFEKQIGETLTIDDLQLLITRSVTEGYFVEYKSQVQSNEKAAKSIAALANTYGGWYFVGVDADKTHNVATNICGFNIASCTDPIATIREIAKSRISPTPIFYPQVVNVTDTLVVLVVYVPDEQDTPFITSEGKIYRRVADSSDPVTEKDRYAVDRLYDRQRQHAKQFERFFRTTPVLFANDPNAWLTIALSPYPSGLLDKYSLIYSENVEQLFLRSQQPLDLYIGDKVIGNTLLSFTSVQPTNDSLILRQVEHAHVASHSLTLELFVDGSARFLIPLQHCNPLTSYQALEGLKSLKAKEALQPLLEIPSAQNQWLLPADTLRFFDIGQLWKVIFALLNFYIDWLGNDLVLIPDMKIAFRLQNARHCVPFLDMDEWGTHVKQFGLPVLFTDTIQVPDEPGKGFVHDVEGNGHHLWSVLGKEIALACGLAGNLILAAILHSFFDIQSIPSDWLTD